jgi:coproporphyrinogen III oxidase-like Fe-S oxidoreductase
MSGKRYATEEERNPDVWFKKTVSVNSSTPKITAIEDRVMLEEKLIMNLRISENIPASIFDYKKLNPVVLGLEENKLIKTKGDEIIIRKRGKKMLDYIARSLVDCF